MELNKVIKKLALQHGFNLKSQPNGEMDLNPYVYDFAKDLIAEVTNKEVRIGAQVKITDIDEVERMVGTVKIGHTGVIVKFGGGGYYIIYVAETNEITALYSSQFEVQG